jgi:RNA polymerase sigma-70 factor (ECF subfamily)
MELVLENTACKKSETRPCIDAKPAFSVPLMDILLEELPLLKCIIAGMGFGIRDAEDIIQDVSVQVLKHRLENASRRSAVAWLKRVTINRCITEYRQRERFRRKAKTIVTHQQAIGNAIVNPEDETIRREQIDTMRQALKHLDDSLLTPLMLRFFCDQNASEIAEILHIKASSVRSRLRKARMLLADVMMKGETENGSQ